MKIKKLKEQGALSGEIQNSNYVKNFIAEYESFSSDWNADIIKKRALSLSKDSYLKVWKFKDN
jgi:hypothetical protein